MPIALYRNVIRHDIIAHVARLLEVHARRAGLAGVEGKSKKRWRRGDKLPCYLHLLTGRRTARLRMELGEDIGFVKIFIFHMHVAAARQPFRRGITDTLACSLRSSQSRVVAAPRQFARRDGTKLEKHRQPDPDNGEEGRWFEEHRVSRTDVRRYCW